MAGDLEIPAAKPIPLLHGVGRTDHEGNMTRPGTCDRTAAAIRGFLEALGSSMFHVGVQNARGMMRHDDLSPEQVLKRIGLLRFFLFLWLVFLQASFFLYRLPDPFC